LFLIVSLITNGSPRFIGLDESEGSRLSGHRWIGWHHPTTYNRRIL